MPRMVQGMMLEATQGKWREIKEIGTEDMKKSGGELIDIQGRIVIGQGGGASEAAGREEREEGEVMNGRGGLGEGGAIRGIGGGAIQGIEGGSIRENHEEKEILRREKKRKEIGASRRRRGKR